MPADGTVATNSCDAGGGSFEFARRASGTVRSGDIAHRKIIRTLVARDMIFCKLGIVRVVPAGGARIATGRFGYVGEVPTWAVFAFAKTRAKIF